MAITSLDILNLSHSLKDICEVNCNTPACLSQTLKILMQYNLIQANLEFSRQFCEASDTKVCLPAAHAFHTPAAPASPCPPPSVLPAAPDALDAHTSTPSASPCPQASTAPTASCPRNFAAPATPTSPATDRPPIRLDIGDPFLADYEK